MRAKLWSRTYLVLVALVFTPATISESSAQTAGTTPIDARRDMLFRAMMAQPSNVEVALDYAILSARAGDLEGAVSTLERLSIFAPGVPRIQFELGVLYYRLGAYETAAGNLRPVAADTAQNPYLARRAERYLVEIDERTGPQTFSGEITVGSRYRTNANGGPDDRSITLFGLPFLLDEDATGQSDVSAFTSTRLTYSHKLPGQGDRFRIDFRGYGEVYDEADVYDTLQGSLVFGPVFDLGRFKIDDATLAINATLGGVVLDEDAYRYRYGIGLALAKTFSPDWRGYLNVDTYRDEYRDTTSRPFASEKTGQRTRGSAVLQHRLSERVVVFGAGFAERMDARSDIESNWEAGGTLGADIALPPPIFEANGPWVLNVSATGLARRFDAGDPIVMLGEDREDDEFRAQASLDVPFAEDWVGTVSTGYRTVDSNADLYSFDDYRVGLSITREF